jgi:Uri superfamily endonuclease
MKEQTYQLYIFIKQRSTIEIGRLGTFDFPAGFYIYTGSAKRGMHKRLARHQSKHKKSHWHIDYLLQHPAASIIKKKKYAELECFVNQKTEGEILVPGFGASDCTAHCASHLKFRHVLYQSANDIDFLMLNN